MLKQIGPYSIVSIVTETEKTIVYRVVDSTGNNAIAKVPRAEQPDIAELARYERELSLLQKVNSPHVVKGLAYIRLGAKAALITEDSASGSDVLTIIKSKTSISMTKFLKLAIDAAKGLKAIHEAKLVHLDINPSNLIIATKDETLKIIDFGIAKELNPNGSLDGQKFEFEGSLPYISPEQTGSMNRVIDHRSDFYSLGVTFYELLTGLLPFQFEDRMSYIHAHIAREAMPLCNVNPAVAPVIGDIVQKLMSKNAEDRYQSAFGLITDLEICLRSLEERHELKRFALGKKDLLDRLDFGHRLYGRDKEQADLKDLFDHAIKGKPQVALVHGFTGMGKTSLVRTLQKVCALNKHLFIEGTSEKGDKDKPFILLTRALDTVFTSILAEGNHAADEFKSAILARIGRAAGLLNMVAPSAEMVLGKLEVPPLDPRERQLVMLITLHSFLEILAERAQGMVLFLDNMHNADPSSLEFLEYVTLRSQVSGLLLIVGYRTNEIAFSPCHDKTLESLRDQKEVSQFELKGLMSEHVSALVAEALHAELRDIAPLAGTVMVKTQGNPLFIGEFLRLLQRNACLQFDYERLAWVFNLKEADALQVSSSLAEFIGEKLNSLDEATKETLAKASIIGQEFSLKDLAALLNNSPEALYATFTKAVESGILSSSTNDYHILSAKTGDASYHERFARLKYRFVHDKLHSIAYAYLSSTQRNESHLAMARIYAAQKEPPENAKAAAHYALVLDKIVSSQEKWHVVNLCLEAGLKAKNSSAFLSAYQAIECCYVLLHSLNSEENRALALRSRLEYMECSFLSGHISAAEEAFQWLSENAAEEEIRSKMYALRAFHLITLGRLNESLRYGTEAIGSLGINVPLKPSLFSLLGQLLQVKRLMKGRAIAEIADLPLMTDPRYLTIMRISGFTVTSAMLTGNKNLFAFLVLLRMRLSILHGLAPSTPSALAGYSILLSHKLHNLIDGEAYGKVLLAIIEKHKSAMQVARALGPYMIFIAAWNLHYSKMKALLRQLNNECLQEGDLAYLGIAAAYAMYYPDDLRSTDITTMLKKTYENLVLSANPDSFDQFYAFKHYWDRLSDNTVTNFGMNHEITPAALVSSMESRNFASGLFVYYTINLKLAYLFGDYIKANEYRQKAAQYQESVLGAKLLIDYHCFGFLALARLYPTFFWHDKKKMKRVMMKSAAFFARFAAHMPDNFKFLQALVMAESERTFGGNWERVQQLYDEAILLAENYNEFWAGFANQEAALWHQTHRRLKLARLYGEHALYLYQRLGAPALCSHVTNICDLKQLSGGSVAVGEHPFTTSRFTTQRGGAMLLSTLNSRTGRGTHHGVNYQNLFETLQDLSDETDFGPLLIRFAKTLLEHSGAEKMVLLLKDPESGALFSVLDCTMDALKSITVKEEALTEEKLPIPLVQLVERSKQTLILDTASKDSDFISDPYIMQHQVLSILCSPLLRASVLVGIIYLENAKSTGAFTPQHEQLVKLLAHQTAATIHSALLQRDLERKVKQNTRDMGMMMQNLKQGIFMIGKEGRVEQGASTYLRQVLETDQITGNDAIGLLFKGSSAESVGA